MTVCDVNLVCRAQLALPCGSFLTFPVMDVKSYGGESIGGTLPGVWGLIYDDFVHEYLIYEYFEGSPFPALAAVTCWGCFRAGGCAQPPF